MIFRALIYFVLILALHGCGSAPVAPTALPTGIPLQDVCDRYHVSWQWDGVTQVVMLEYKGNKAKALVGSATVLLGQHEITLSAPLRRENSTIYVPEDFESKVLAPFGVSIGGLEQVASSSRVHTIIIDAGHGGKDRGTMAPSGGGMDEKEIVLDVAKRLQMLLEGAGINVIMTRDTDDFISLQERTEIASRSGADLFISIHVNSNEDRAVKGLLIYYMEAFGRKDLYDEQRLDNERIMAQSLNPNASDTLRGIVADMMYELKFRQSKKLAKLIIREARQEDINVRGDGLRLCRFFVVRNTLLPSILVETGFISNRQERSKLDASSYRQKMAEVIARGVLDYANE